MSWTTALLALSLAVGCGPRYDYDYECVKTGKVKVERCVSERSTHITNDASGSCAMRALESMSGSEYCKVCEKYAFVEEHACVEWKRTVRK